MITVDAWTTNRDLRTQGKSIRSSSKELDVSRNTVRAATIVIVLMKRSRRESLVE
jgi:transposase